MTNINRLQQLAGLALNEGVTSNFTIIDIDLYSQEFKRASAQGSDVAEALANYLQDPEAVEHFRQELQGNTERWGLKANPAGGYAYKGEEQLILIM